MDAKKYTDIALLRRLFLQAKPQWAHLFAILVLDLLATPLALLVPVPLMLAVDNILGDKPLPPIIATVLPEIVAMSAGYMLALVVAMVVLIALLNQAQQFATWLMQTYVGEKLSLEFRALLLQHAQRLSLAYHDTRGTADAIYRIQYDAPSIQWVVLYGITPFVTASFTIISMIAITASLDWRLAMVAMAISPVLFFLTVMVRDRLRDQWRDVKNLETSALGIIQEVLGALRVVKAFGQEDREQQRFFRRSREGMGARIQVVLSESLYTSGVALTIAGGTAAVLYIGVVHVREGTLSLGQLLLVMSYLTQLYGPLQSFGQQVGKLQGGLASAERAYALMDEQVHVTESPNARPLARAAGAFRLEHVGFAYDGTNLVLQDVSLNILAGSKVGIIGRTGSGKTTLINLLSRLYDPNQGTVFLDGVDIRRYKLADLRNQFAIVLQDPVLFSTTIRENIAYGRPGALDEEITAAAKAADAHDFISAMPDGYQTEVGERGLKLSGGQRQRLSLARAFLKDAPILLLDEPTSSVDVKTETAIMHAMERLMRGRTTFMIAHRLSTINHCDFVVELEGGRVQHYGRISDSLATSDAARRSAGLAHLSA